MTIGETRTRYRVYDPSEFVYVSKAGGWTDKPEEIWTFDRHAEAFRIAHDMTNRAFEAGEIVIKPVRFRRVASNAARELVAVKAELAAANEQNERLAAALRKALTQEIPQAEKADFMRVAMGREPAKEGGS